MRATSMTSPQPAHSPYEPRSIRSSDAAIRSRARRSSSPRLASTDAAVAALAVSSQSGSRSASELLFVSQHPLAAPEQ